jgi:hypothetical protein
LIKTKGKEGSAMAKPVKLIEADLGSLGEVDLAARLVFRLLQSQFEPSRKIVEIIEDDIRAIEAEAKKRGYDQADESS